MKNQSAGEQMTFTLSEAATYLTQYPSQRALAFRQLVAARADFNSAYDDLQGKISTGESLSVIQAQQIYVNSLKVALNARTNAVRSLNDTRKIAQGVVNFNSNIATAYQNDVNPIIGPTGPRGIQGDVGPQGPMGMQGFTGPVSTTPGPTGAASTVTGPQGIPGATGPVGATGPMPVVAGTANAIQFNNSGALGGIAPGPTGAVILSQGSSAAPVSSVVYAAFGPLLTGVSVPTNVYFEPSSIGDNALYTVPTGKRMLLNGFSCSNGSGATISIFQTVRVGSTTTRLLNVASLATGTNVTTYQYSMVFEPGDVVGFNLSAIGLNMRWRAVLFDSTSNLRMVRKLDSWVNGDNTVYTVPANVSAASVAITPYMQDIMTFRGAYHNATGASVSARIQVKPAAITNRISLTTSVNASTVTNNSNLLVANSVTLASGDSIIVQTNSTSNAQAFWLVMIEYT